MAGTIERAYELAQSGECKTMTEISRRLNREGYDVVGHFDGVLIRRQVNKMIKDYSASSFISGEVRLGPARF